MDVERTLAFRKFELVVEPLGLDKNREWIDYFEKWKFYAHKLEE